MYTKISSIGWKRENRSYNSQTTLSFAAFRRVSNLMGILFNQLSLFCPEKKLYEHDGKMHIKKSCFLLFLFTYSFL